MAREFPHPPTLAIGTLAIRAGSDRRDIAIRFARGLIFEAEQNRIPDPATLKVIMAAIETGTNRHDILQVLLNSLKPVLPYLESLIDACGEDPENYCR